jgi:hypothetical protein
MIFTQYLWGRWLFMKLREVKWADQSHSSKKEQTLRHKPTFCGKNLVSYQRCYRKDLSLGDAYALQFGSGVSPFLSRLMVPCLWHYWKVVESLGGGVQWEEVRSLRVCPWRGYWEPGPFLPLSLLPGCHEMNTFPSNVLPTMICCLPQAQRQWGQATLD